MPPSIVRLILDTLLALVQERLDEYPDRKPPALKDVETRLIRAVNLSSQDLVL